MKLVELLARELNEWPCDGPATQDPDKEIRFDKPSHDFYVKDLAEDAGDDHGSGVEVTRAQWQAERDRQNGGEWKRHRGGKCPVDAGQKVGYKFRGGDQGECLAGHLMWDHQQDESDVMKYRVISHPQAEEVELSKAEARAPFMKPVIVYPEAAQVGTISYNISVDQIAGPLAWRDTIIHCQAIIEDCEREIASNGNLLALEGFALIPAMTPVMGVADIDMSDWRNWKVGDLISPTETDWVDLSKGEVYPISFKGDDFVTLYDDAGDKRNINADSEDILDGSAPILEFEWVSRP